MFLMQSNFPSTRQCDQSPSSHQDHVWENRVMLIAFLFDAAGRYFRYRSQLASIIELDDRTLSDIGLNRSELRAVAWTAAAHWARH
jgi:uncharacterized protein YjiS (DUF1127 family)